MTATQKLDPPTTKTEVVDFSKLSEGEKVAAFKEAMSNKDLYSILGLEKPTVETPSKNKEVIEKLLPEYEGIRSKLAEAGYKFEEAKMSESERIIHEKLEKQAQAKFAEQKTDILGIDADFPVEAIAKMSIPTEDKVTVMATLKEVAVRNSEAIANVRKELDVATAELKEAKLAAPEADKPEGESGEDIVSAKLGEWGFDDLNKNKSE